MDECAQNGLKETMKERKRERERDLVGPRGGNFDAVTGFMSFLPFGGFHFQSGLLELVIQTRPTNERTPSSSSSSSSLTSSPTFSSPLARNSRRLAHSLASGFPTDLLSLSLSLSSILSSFVSRRLDPAAKPDKFDICFNLRRTSSNPSSPPHLSRCPT